jgi:tetratricopeptide (TPR) repeat protein
VIELKTNTNKSWSPKQAITLALFSLLLGVCGGWLIRKSFAAAVPQPAQVVSTPEANAAAVQPVPSQPVSAGLGAVPATPTAQELKIAADNQAAPLLAQLYGDKNNAALLTKLGNLYYDAEQYPDAIQYYERSLKVEPSDPSVRTDLGTAYWYKGDPETAIAQFNKALSIAPTKADTLFNLGVVKWQGKKEAQGAIAAWQKLLDTNPNYENKEKVRQFIAQAQNR